MVMKEASLYYWKGGSPIYAGHQHELQYLAQIASYRTQVRDGHLKTTKEWHRRARE